MNGRDFSVSLKRFFPFLRWPRPTAETFGRDAWAGISVGLVLVPQAVAYATLAGMPPQTGLYAALLPSVIGILWGSSSLLAVGPVALTSMLVFGSLAPLATPGTADWVALAIWLSLYAGVIQFLLGSYRLGQITNLVSQPVVTGLINAAAILIILSQLPAFFGIAAVDSVAAFRAGLDHLLTAPSEVAITSAFGLGALLLLFAFKRFFPKWPGMLLVALIGIGLSWLLDYAGRGGAIVGALPGGIPPLLLPPAIPFESHRDLWPAALIVALISFTEAMSSCRALARKKQEQWNENQELIGQGLAKIASGFSGAFPVSGSFSRSALNLYAGAVSGWSTLFSALCVLFSLLWLMDFISWLPRSVLAAMIMVPVFSLIDFPAFRRLFAVSRDDGMVAVTTFVATLLAAPRLHWGVFAGVGLAMASYLYRRSRPRIIEVSLHPDGTLRDRNRFTLPQLAPNMLTVRMDSGLTFLTAAALERFIVEHCRDNPDVRRVLLCASGINDIDASGVDTLSAIQASLKSQDIDLYLSAVKKQVWDVLDRAGIIEALGKGRIFATDADAVRAMSCG